MRITVGGPENLTFIHLDIKNRIRSTRDRQMQGGVVEFLLDYFVTQSKLNMGKYSKIKIDRKKMHKLKASCGQMHKCVGTIELLVIASALTQPTETTNTIDL
ncbi:hypothetical protein LINPERPRIM_LOCUS21093 [Linum perenne]